MLSRDYISRIIRTFFEAVEKLFDGRCESEAEFERRLNDLYRAYFERSRAVLIADSPGELIAWLEEDPCCIEKCEMLGEIFYREYHLTASPELKRNMGLKVIALYEYVNQHSTDYSLLYANRILELQAALEA